MIYYDSSMENIHCSVLIGIGFNNYVEIMFKILNPLFYVLFIYCLGLRYSSLMTVRSSNYIHNYGKIGFFACQMNALKRRQFWSIFTHFWLSSNKKITRVSNKRSILLVIFSSYKVLLKNLRKMRNFRIFCTFKFIQ